MNVHRGWLRSIAAASILAASTPARPQTAPDPAGYTITRSQTVEQPRAGWVGRKTTDTERRVGNSEGTDGDETVSVLTVGGFARVCPTAAGEVPGTFEFTITVDDVNTGEGETRRKHISQRMTAELVGHTTDKGLIELVDFNGELVRNDHGTDIEAVSYTKSFKTTFKLGEGGMGDFAATLDAVEKTGELAFSTGIWMSSSIYFLAVVELNKAENVNRCVELTFDPPTDERSLDPNAAVEVRTVLRAKEDQASVAGAELRIQALRGAGRVSPGALQTQADAPGLVTYTASPTPRSGDGFSVTTRSRAGLAEAQWRITERQQFEGTYTLTQVNGPLTYTNRGQVVWTPTEPDVPSQFGGAPSTFLRPSGEITVDFAYARAGCTANSTKTFAIEAMPAEARKYLWLEIADDGRYALSLEVFAHFFMDFDLRCPRVPQQRLPAPDAAVHMGVQSGTMGEAGVLGSPVATTGLAVSGNWSFVRKAPRN